MTGDRPHVLVTVAGPDRLHIESWSSFFSEEDRSMFLREMVRFREIHERRVLEHCAADEARREELAERLGDPDAVEALLDALRAGEDLADGLAVVRRRTAGGR